MKTVLFSGLAATSLLIAASAVHASDSWVTSSNGEFTEAFGLTADGVRAPKPGMGGGSWGVPKLGKPPVMGDGNWHGPKPGKPPVMGGGNWHGGKPVTWHPRPGNHGIPKHDIYRRPYRGFTVASWWAQPSFYIPNYTIYGLSAPSSGYRWSRYYDDAVLINNQGYVADYRNGIEWDRYNSSYTPAPNHYQPPEYGPAIRPDSQAYSWEGGYDAPAYREDDYYEDDWSSEADYAPGAPYAPYGGPDYAPEAPYRVPAGYEGYERCLKSNGLTGGVIGGILGGVAGNQIAGRGDKLGGTLLGVGLGGLAGVAVEKAVSKCKSYAPRTPQYNQPRYQPAPQYHPAPPVAYPPQGYGPPPQQQGYGYSQHQYYQGGYYYAQPQVTVTVVPGHTTTTTTTTEEYVYETVSVPVKKRIVKKWKPKPKPRCVCR